MRIWLPPRTSVKHAILDSVACSLDSCCGILVGLCDSYPDLNHHGNPSIVIQLDLSSNLPDLGTFHHVSFRHPTCGIPCVIRSATFLDHLFSLPTLISIQSRLFSRGRSALVTLEYTDARTTVVSLRAISVQFRSVFHDVAVVTVVCAWACSPAFLFLGGGGGDWRNCEKGDTGTVAFFAISPIHGAQWPGVKPAIVCAWVCITTHLSNSVAENPS